MAEIRVDVGDEAFGRGRTTVTIDEKGTIEVELVRHIRVKKELSEEMKRDQVTAIFRILNERELDTPPKRKMLPDEQIIRVTVDGRTLEIPADDVERSPATDSLIRKVREVVRHVTRGEVDL